MTHPYLVYVKSTTGETLATSIVDSVGAMEAVRDAKAYDMARRIFQSEGVRCTPHARKLTISARTLPRGRWKRS